jgi:hypothetical protein
MDYETKVEDSLERAWNELGDSTRIHWWVSAIVFALLEIAKAIRTK